MRMPVFVYCTQSHGRIMTDNLKDKNLSVPQYGFLEEQVQICHEGFSQYLYSVRRDPSCSNSFEEDHNNTLTTECKHIAKQASRKRRFVTENSKVMLHCYCI